MLILSRPATRRPWAAPRWGLSQRRDLASTSQDRAFVRTRVLEQSRSQRRHSEQFLDRPPEDEPCPAIPAGAPLLIDEAQRLPRAVRRQVFASGLPLVLATHRSLRRSLVRAGYQVQTHYIGQTNDAALLCKLLNRRIEASRLNSAGQIPQLTPEDASALVNRFGSDIRAIESYLYEVVQTQVFSHGEMRFVDPVR